MLPKSNSKKMAFTTLKKKGKAVKRKQSLIVYSDTEGTTKDEEEPSLWDMIANIGAMLTNMTTRMEGYEKRHVDRWMTMQPHTRSSQPSLRFPPVRQLQDKSLPDQYRLRCVMPSKM